MSLKTKDINQEMNITLNLKVTIDSFLNHNGFTDKQIENAIEEFKEEIQKEIEHNLCGQYEVQEFLQTVDFVNYTIEVSKTENEIITLNDIKNVIEKLPHSIHRVPYTYHHDYLRMNSKKHKNMSRSEVASNHEHDEFELYVIALCQILEDVGGNIINCDLTQDELTICKKAKTITKKIIEL